MEAHSITLPKNDLTVNELKDTYIFLSEVKQKLQVKMKLVLMLLGNVSEVYVSLYFIYLMFHYKMELFRIARVTLSFKNGSISDLGNYRQISVLPSFSRRLEKTMCNYLHKYLCDNILYRKKFGFQEKHSTEYAIMQLVDQINCSFEKSLYTLSIFINFSKAFDNADYKILITILDKYGVKGTHIRWFKNYLENRKQFSAYENFSTYK